MDGNTGPSGGLSPKHLFIVSVSDSLACIVAPFSAVVRSSQWVGTLAFCKQFLHFARRKYSPNSQNHPAVSHPVVWSVVPSQVEVVRTEAIFRVVFYGSWFATCSYAVQTSVTPVAMLSVLSIPMTITPIIPGLH